MSSLVHLARTIELQSTTPSYPKASQGVTLGVRSDSKHRQLVHQVGGVSLTSASSMVVTSQCKIALRSGSMFYFGTILSIADEKGTLHLIADPPEKKFSLEIPRKTEDKQRTVQPPAPRAKIASYKQKIRTLPARRSPLLTSPTREWTRITRKKEASVPRKGTELHQVIFPAPSPSKEDRNKLAIITNHFYPDILFIGGDWNRLPSPTTSRPCRGKSLPSVKHDNEGTCAEIFGNITRLGSRTQLSPYLGMKFQKWEKPPTSGYTEKGGILADVIADKLSTESANKPSRAQGYAERITSSLET
jgi:hypothetical protein